MTRSPVYDLAKSAYESRNWAEAARLGGELVALDPECVEGWHWCGAGLMFEGKYEQAAAAFDEATKVVGRTASPDGSWRDLYFSYACVLAKLHKTPDAKEMLLRAIRGSERMAEIALVDEWLAPLFSDLELMATLRETRDAALWPGERVEATAPPPEATLVDAPLAKPSKSDKDASIELTNGQPLELLFRLDRSQAIRMPPGPYLACTVVEKTLLAREIDVDLEEPVPDFVSALDQVLKRGLDQLLMDRQADLKEMEAFIRDPVLRRLGGQTFLSVRTGDDDLEVYRDRRTPGAWRTVISWESLPPIAGASFKILRKAEEPAEPVHVAKLDFELGRIWVPGMVDFEEAADLVGLHGELILTVDGKLVPGVRGYQWAVMNDWLRSFHKLLYPGEMRIEFETGAKRDPGTLLEERVELFRGHKHSVLKVTNPVKRRPVIGFERIALDSDQVLDLAVRFERRLRDLLLRITTPERAATWWKAQTKTPIEEAGLARR
jgi:hypothetical protein